MKYYNAELNNASGERIAEVHRNYHDYVESIRAFIPAALYFLAGQVNFHDYVIEHWSLDVGAQSLHLRIHGEMVANTYDVRWFAITYTGVTDFRFGNKQTNQSGPKTLEAGNTEIELLDAEQRRYEHRWGFIEGSEMIVRFSDVTFTNLELPEPERISVQSETLYYEGRDASAKNDYETAVKKFAEALELRPEHTPFKFLLAKAKYCLGDFDTAEMLLREVLKEQPKHRGALLYLVLVLEGKEQWYDLLLLCNEEVRKISGEVELIYIKSLVHTGNKNEAWEMYRNISRKTVNRHPMLRKEVLALLHKE